MLISLRLLFGLDAMQYLYNVYIPQVFLLVPCEDNAQGIPCNSSTSSSYLAILHLLVLSICPPRGTMSSDNTSCLEQSDVCKLSAVGQDEAGGPSEVSHLSLWSLLMKNEMFCLDLRTLTSSVTLMQM